MSTINVTRSSIPPFEEYADAIGRKNKMIPNTIPPYTGEELGYLSEAIGSHKISGDGAFTERCSAWIEENFLAKKALLTTSGSSALDMAALLCEIKVGDEVILPSYTFSSTANCFVLAGAKLVFVDIRPDTMNIDEKKIEAAITEKTKVICVVHYAGVACEMDTIMNIANRYGLLVVEDAAQAVMSSYKGKALGTIGDFGCYSFHETKNYSMGEGGAILINSDKYVEKAEILREKGTNRSQFLRGQIDKYTWVDFGDSYLPSELNAAYLWPQLLHAKIINEKRLESWNYYNDNLLQLAKDGRLILPTIPVDCIHNAHLYYVRLKDLQERTAFISFLKENGVQSVFHYVPLHSAPAGLTFGRFNGNDEYTTSASEQLARLPMYYRLKREDQDTVISAIYSFFSVQ